MRKRLLFLLALVLLLALAACGGGGGEESQGDTSNETNNAEEEAPPAEGGTVTIASNSEPGNLNPMVWATIPDTIVTDMVYDALVVPDDELKMVGSLAKDWDVSEDGTSYTFYLEEGITWHDGEPFTAEDVEFTFTSIADPRYDAEAYWRAEPIMGAEEYREGNADSIEGIEVIDDNTIKFTMEEPYAPFISGLFIGILPKHILSDVAPNEWDRHESNRNPIGTGPFKFVEWKTGQYIHLEKNEDYFGGAPILDTIYVRFGDANSMLASFMNKEVDITEVPIAEVESIQSLDYAELITQPTLSVQYVGFNGLNEHFKDKLVRRALSHATDKSAIVESILGEYGVVSKSIFASEHWSHNPDVPIYEYDIEKAESLLEEAGYEKNSEGIFEKGGNPLSFTLEVPTGNKEREKTATLLKQMWEEVGVEVELQSQDLSTLTTTKLVPTGDDGTQREVTADDYDAFLLGLGFQADPDEYRSYFSSKYMPPKGYNFVSYSNPKVDELWVEQTLEIDFDKRQEIIQQIGYELSDDEVWIPLFEQETPFVINKRVQGFELSLTRITLDAKDWSVSE